MFDSVTGESWCRRDSGPIDYADSLGRRHTAHVSLTRDGSVWLRFQSAESGDDSSADWTYVDETQQPLQLSVLEPSVIPLLEDLNYTDFCALTDLQLSLAAQSGWHPSYLTAYDPRARQKRTILFRHNRDCEMSTKVTLSGDRQVLLCDGGDRKTACGQRGLPERGQRTTPLFLLSVNFDPAGPDHWQCVEEDDASQPGLLQPSHNSYTFYGSYYQAYVKVASCDTPHGTSTRRLSYFRKENENWNYCTSFCEYENENLTICETKTIIIAGKTNGNDETIANEKRKQNSWTSTSLKFSTCYISSFIVQMTNRNCRHDEREE